MKVLRSLKTISNLKQILSWLHWIQDSCQCRLSCSGCPLSGPCIKDVVCRVRNIYREVRPEVDKPPMCPEFWRLSWPECFGELIRKEPGDLDFLYKIKWDNSGNPIIPELKGDK